MDSCNVMRGSKSGLEKRIREERAPHLLDIDGDTCHHAHNAAKAFCKPFRGGVESLLCDLHTDFKWSPESREHFYELCRLIKVSASTPQQYAAHSWLSVLNVSLDTLRLLNPLVVYYSCYLQPKSFKIYKEQVQQAQSACFDMAALKSLKKKIAAKTTTSDGKLRKARITEKLFTHNFHTTTTLHFYALLLPSIEKYVKFFQSREPKMHLLHSKQEEILKSFLGNFIKPESLNLRELKDANLEDKSLRLPKSLMFYGERARVNLESRNAKDTLRVAFENKALQAFIQAGKVLINKMPLSSTTMKAFAYLDPELRGTTTSMLYMHKFLMVLPDLKGHEDSFKEEVKSFQIDHSIETIAARRIDKCWGQVCPKTYPLLTAVARAVLPCFHGALVESTFSVMGKIVTKCKTNLDIKTCSACQTIKHHLQSKNTTSSELYAKKNPEKDPVNQKLTQNIRGAAKLHKEQQTQHKHTKTKGKVTKKAELDQLRKDLAPPTHTSGSKRPASDTCEDDHASITKN